MLYRTVQDFETFQFIEEEFRGFLRCGFLAAGLARFHCAGYMPAPPVNRTEHALRRAASRVATRNNPPSASDHWVV